MALLRRSTGDYKTRLLQKQRLQAQHNVGDQLQRAVPPRSARQAPGRLTLGRTLASGAVTGG